jgi:hypothetical protein
MKNSRKRYIPLVVTVGQVAIFPYYIVWLKEVSFTFTIFAWLFATFSFSAAWGYRVYQVKKPESSIPFIYVGMGTVYLLVGFLNQSFEFLPYFALLLQIILGFLQGYFRAWHVEQKDYRLHVVHHYLIVGVIMLGLSFIKIISPVAFITAFGSVLCVCGIWGLLVKTNGEHSS